MKNRNTIRNVQILKGMVIVTSIILIVFGIAMVFMGIKGQNSMTIKTSLIEGGINTNYVGLVAIFLGAVLALGAILKPYRFSRKKRFIESGDLKIREEEEIEITRNVDENSGGD